MKLSVLVGLLAAPVLALGAGALYQTIGSNRDRRVYPPRGRLVDAGCGRLHLHEQGAGTPTVILESGIAASSLSWALVQPSVAQFTKVCSYDRAGLGWSDRCRTPRTLTQIITELKALLENSGMEPPYILVGHSFGGLLIRAYAHLEPANVAGLVFIDPASAEHWAARTPEELRRLRLGVDLSRRGALLARFGVVRFALTVLASGGRKLPKFLARATAQRQGSGFLERIGGEIRKLPPEVWPLIRAHWSRAQSFEAMALSLEALPEAARWARTLPISADIPFVVLSAGNATEAELAERNSWVAESANGRHVQVAGTGHWLQLERPDLMTEAIREVIAMQSTTKAKTPQ